MTLAAVAFTWSVNRAAGLAALTLASASVGAGTLLSARGRAGGLTRPDLRPLHEALSLATLAALLLHVVAFAVDGFFGAGLTGTVVPFASPYRPVAVTIGQLAGVGLALLGLSAYVRNRIGPARWRRLHRFVAVAWALAVLHSLLAGSDTGRPWFLVAALAPAAAAALAVALRYARGAPATPR